MVVARMGVRGKGRQSLVPASALERPEREALRGESLGGMQSKR
jgi:hypothetical protein